MILCQVEFTGGDVLMVLNNRMAASVLFVVKVLIIFYHERHEMHKEFISDAI